MLTEPDLLDRLRSGSDEAFAELVRECSGRMFAVARRLLNDEHEAGECVQEAFLQAYKNLSGFDGRASIATWLHRVVVNAALMRLRTQKRRGEVLLDDLPQQFSKSGGRLQVDPTDDLPGVQEVLEREETREWVRAAIAKLPESYRTVLVLRDIEEYDTNETAQLLNTTPGALKTRLHRARALLKHALEQTRGSENR